MACISSRAEHILHFLLTDVKAGHLSEYFVYGFIWALICKMSGSNKHYNHGERWDFKLHLFYKTRRQDGVQYFRMVNYDFCVQKNSILKED